ncbi:hypothetical protein GSI_06426 [Ganoderma sinense ZZ0214-1]|uniref:Uncharacterized protein n=1 Tax=Ganoderma sinense ZZ0214-1 TaxID=1077348 RepID=A0A2G8SD91_9APHY|nr:hypothetical protein GSI_06426 [Ganoderma sinense ZZ0214-1]
MFYDLKASWGLGALSCLLRLGAIVSSATVALVAQHAALRFYPQCLGRTVPTDKRGSWRRRGTRGRCLSVHFAARLQHFGACVAKLDSDYSCVVVLQPPIFLFCVALRGLISSVCGWTSHPANVVLCYLIGGFLRRCHPCIIVLVDLE